MTTTFSPRRPMSKNSKRSSNSSTPVSKPNEANSGFKADCSAFTRSLLPKFGTDSSSNAKAYHKPRIYMEALERHILQMEDRLRALGVQPPAMQRIGSSQGLHGCTAASIISDMEEQIESLEVEIEELEQENEMLSMLHSSAFAPTLGRPQIWKNTSSTVHNK